MNPHTITDVIIILIIFLVLIISFSVLAWRRPTSLGSLRALPTHGAVLPAPNIAVVTHGGRLPYLMRLRRTLFMIYHWRMRASYDRIDRIPPITVSHHEYTVARAPSVRTPSMYTTLLSTRTNTTIITTATTTIAVTSSSDASTINIEATELRELDKGPSTSSVLETNDADITNIQRVATAGEPIARIRMDPLSVAHDPTLSTNPTVEIDITAID